jgi:hypothetical protein
MEVNFSESQRNLLTLSLQLWTWWESTKVEGNGHDNEISCSMKGGKFLELLTDYSYLKRTVLKGVEFLHHMMQFYIQIGTNTVQKSLPLYSRTNFTTIYLKQNAKST